MLTTYGQSMLEGAPYGNKNAAGKRGGGVSEPAYHTLPKSKQASIVKQWSKMPLRSLRSLQTQAERGISAGGTSARILSLQHKQRLLTAAVMRHSFPKG
jgi:hypothetical protein